MTKLTRGEQARLLANEVLKKLEDQKPDKARDHLADIASRPAKMEEEWADALTRKTVAEQKHDTEQKNRRK